MRRKDDAQSELEGVARRLRRERPEASPLELDQIKTATMSRNRITGRGRIGTRRLAVLGLTVGLLAATTGTVIAGQGGSEPTGNAAIAQYGNNCDVNNNNGPIGNGNGSGGNGNESGDGNNYNCNENSFNQTINNYAGSTTTVNNNYTTVPASGAVLGSKSSSKAKTSGRRIKIHVKIPHGAKLRKVTVTVNGKHLKTLLGKKASANIELVKLPCTTGATTVQISITLSNGKTVTARHSYHLCAS